MANSSWTLRQNFFKYSTLWFLGFSSLAAENKSYSRLYGNISYYSLSPLMAHLIQHSWYAALWSNHPMIVWSEVKSLGRVQLFATPWTVAYQAPPSLGFSRQEYWNGLPFPSPRDLPNPGIEPGSPVLQATPNPTPVDLILTLVTQFYFIWSKFLVAST